MSNAVESKRKVLSGPRQGAVSSRRNVLNLIGETIIKTLLLAGISCWLSQSEPAEALGSNSATNRSNSGGSSKPIWQRAGCYQVGHTRTISIPGCVKFNLSTNACRGYCMSFSIPANEDIGPGASSAELYGDGFHEWRDNLANDFLASERAIKRHEIARRKRRLTPMLWPDEYPSVSTSSRHKEDSLAATVSRQNSPLAGAVGNMAEKRDVISVGQCCNMMETEDVTVNLRCGFNETRRLVFKSAKTCECFFCKQV